MDGTGLLLCPGFIDMHTHSALVAFDDPYLAPKLAQGFTTEVINPDGLAPAPVAPEGRAFLDLRFVTVVEKDGELVSFMIGVPDLWEGLVRSRGRLWPLGWSTSSG